VEPDDRTPFPASETLAEEGFPTFQHNQWTVEGEIERLQSFGIAGARATGWKRGVALFLVAMFVLPLVLSVAVMVSQAR
jgi:hypothetical protein